MEAETTALRNALAQAGIGVRRLAAQARYAKSTVGDYLDGYAQATDTRERLVEAARQLGVQIPPEPWASEVKILPQQAPRFGDSSYLRRSAPTHRPPTLNPAGEAGEEDTLVIPTSVSIDRATRTHWGMTRNPFDELKAGIAWENPRLRAVKDAVVDAIRERRIIAVIGEPGMGKSTLFRSVRHACQEVHGDRVLWMTPGDLDLKHISQGSLASAMLRDLGLDADFATLPSERRGDTLRKELQRRVDGGDYPVLGLDESHDLRPHGLIAIKRIWDSFTFHRSLAVVLAGQEPLAHALETNPAVREVTGRTELVRLPEFGAAEAEAYLGYRLGLVGLQAGEVFEHGAVDVLVTRGGTAPLWLHALASRAFIDAAKRGTHIVTRAIAARC